MHNYVNKTLQIKFKPLPARHSGHHQPSLPPQNRSLPTLTQTHSWDQQNKQPLVSRTSSSTSPCLQSSKFTCLNFSLLPSTRFMFHSYLLSTFWNAIHPSRMKLSSNSSMTCTPAFKKLFFLTPIEQIP